MHIIDVIAYHRSAESFMYFDRVLFGSGDLNDKERVDRKRTQSATLCMCHNNT